MEEHLEGVRLAERILGGTAPPLDALAAIAAEYVLIGQARPELITDKEAHDSISDWVVKRLVLTLQPSIQPKAAE